MNYRHASTLIHMVFQFQLQQESSRFLDMDLQVDVDSCGHLYKTMAG